MCFGVGIDGNGNVSAGTSVDDDGNINSGIGLGIREGIGMRVFGEVLMP